MNRGIVVGIALLFFCVFGTEQKSGVSYKAFQLYLFELVRKIKHVVGFLFRYIVIAFSAWYIYADSNTLPVTEFLDNTVRDVMGKTRDIALIAALVYWFFHPHKKMDQAYQGWAILAVLSLGVLGYFISNP